MGPRRRTRRNLEDNINMVACESRDTLFSSDSLLKTDA